MIEYLRKHRHLVWQLLLIGFSAIILFISINNYQVNLSSRNIRTGFDFLGDTAGFAIKPTLIEYSQDSSYFRVYLVGVLNTLFVSGLAIVLATVLGFLLGMSRLSRNWLLRNFAYGYMELFRNVPPLLHVLFWYQVFFLRLLPDKGNPLVLGNNIYINIRGITIPELSWHSGGLAAFWLSLLLVAVLCYVIYRYRRHLISKGVYRNMTLYYLAVFAVFVLAFGFFPAADLISPELGKFGFTKGVAITPEIIALVVALSTYTAVYIGEAIRSSVEAVPKGQSEAAMSLGLSYSLRMRLVVLPQAFRTVIPPMTSLYLNILKNSSLGIVVGYADLVNVFSGSTLNQIGRALEVMSMTMATYLVISIVTSLLMNSYNRKLLAKGLK